MRFWSKLDFKKNCHDFELKIWRQTFKTKKFPKSPNFKIDVDWFVSLHFKHTWLQYWPGKPAHVDNVRASTKMELGITY